MAKSRSETASRSCRWAPEAQQLGGQVPVHGVGGARQGAGAQGHSSIRSLAVLQPGHVPAEHDGVGHHVVGEGGGLGPLQVGVAGHDSFQIFFPPFGSTCFRSRTSQDLVDLRAGVQPDVHGHLIVAAAGGVEALPASPMRWVSRLRCSCGCPLSNGEPHLARLDIRQDAV